MKSEAVLITVAVVLSAVIFTTGLKREDIKTATVRGFSEREVDADIATWPLKFTCGGESLDEVRKTLGSNTAIIKDYLAGFNLLADTAIQAPDIRDATLDRYNNTGRGSRYTAGLLVVIRSRNVDAIKKAAAGAIDLVDRGVILENSYDSHVQYEFTGLAAIKPDMVSESIKNAREAAESFARDSGQRLGAIHRATQGLFTIESHLGAGDKKTVRVTTSIDWILK